MDRVPAVLLFIVLSLALVVSWRSFPVVVRLIGLAVAGACALVIYSVGWRRLTLDGTTLEVRDRIRRVRRIPIDQVARITYVRKACFHLALRSGASMAFDPNTPGLESFIETLATRAARMGPVDIAGDLEVTSGDLSQL